MAKAKKAKKKVLCYCGCGAEVNNKFKQGHDSKLKASARKVARGEMKITDAIANLHPEARREFRAMVATLKDSASAKKAVKKSKKTSKKTTKPEAATETEPTAEPALAS